jgi:hypothetical protein
MLDRQLGLLLPEEIRYVCEKTGLSAVNMSLLLGVGEKTYTRWENGRSLQTKASDTLIRLIDKNPEEFAILAAEREQNRKALIEEYFRDLEQIKGRNQLAMAAHGGELSTEVWNAVRNCLAAIRNRKNEESWVMAKFNVGYLKLESFELARYQLKSTGQQERECVNPHDLVTFLKLEFLWFNFARELPEDARRTITGDSPRALLSFADRIITVDDTLDDNWTRFSVLHEISHYVLPNHEHTLYVCDEAGLSSRARLVMEAEANKFAADLLFIGDRFVVKANALPISAGNIKQLAMKYQESFIATARRFVQKNFRHCMLIVFERSKESGLNTDVIPAWTVHYSVASPMFKTRYFEKITGSLSPEIAGMFTKPGRDFSQDHQSKVNIKTQHGEETAFTAEYFSNTYNIFCLLTP